MARHVHDEDRRELEAALERQIGAGPTATLMALLPPVDWSEIARQSDLVAVRDDVAELKTDVIGIKTEMVLLRSDLGQDMRMLKAEHREFRSFVREDLSKMREDLAAMTMRLIFVIIATMISLAGIVLTAVKL